MRLSSSTSLITLLMICAAFCGQVQAQQYQWQALPGAPVSWRFDDMYFLNPQEGWAINPNYSYLTPVQFGRVVHTSDGGQTWATLFDGANTFIRSVGFADSQTGWFGNLGEYTPDTNFMYQTTNGGQNWAPVTAVTGPRPSGICGISVVSDSLIFAYGRYSSPTVMMRTQDKGATWESQSLDNLASGLVDAWFFGQDTGFVVGSYGIPRRALVLSTVDGGDSWQVRHQGQRADEILWKVFFPTRQVGYASVQSWIDGIGLAPDTSWVLKTTDGGLTWHEKSVRTNAFYELQGIGFINELVGWVGGDCCNPVTFATTDGGDTWAPATGFGSQTPPYNTYTGYAVNRFRKFGDTLMYCAGNTIYRMEETIASGIANAQSESAVQVFPNPSCGASTVKLRGLPSTDCLLELYDSQGHLIRSSKKANASEMEITVSGLATGLYTYRCMSHDIQIAQGRLLITPQEE